MKVFDCPSCGETLFFENLACAGGAEVAFDPEAHRFVPLDAPCANRAKIGCNWTGPAGGGLCRCCAMTRVIPDTLADGNLARFAEAERHKRWVIACLGRWGWFRDDDPGPRPIFDLLSEATSKGEAQVTMGHASGLVTINVMEADEATRAARRQALGEQFRTMVGHFRHELGHFFFERLAGAKAFLPQFRDLFGDERADYAKALQDHYAREEPVVADDYVTPYAAAHPHEDWAEIFSHLLHLTDICDSALAAGLISPLLADPGWDPYAADEPGRIVAAGAELAIALNHVNRSMGHADPYPFVLTPPVRRKIAFAHGWLHAGPAGIAG